MSSYHAKKGSSAARIKRGHEMDEGSTRKKAKLNYAGVESDSEGEVHVAREDTDAGSSSGSDDDSDSVSDGGSEDGSDDGNSVTDTIDGSFNRSLIGSVHVGSSASSSVESSISDSSSDTDTPLTARLAVALRGGEEGQAVAKDSEVQKAKIEEAKARFREAQIVKKQAQDTQALQAETTKYKNLLHCNIRLLGTLRHAGIMINHEDAREQIMGVLKQTLTETAELIGDDAEAVHLLSKITEISEGPASFFEQQGWSAGIETMMTDKEHKGKLIKDIKDF